MSGGFFDYRQFQLRDLADEISELIDKQGKSHPDSDNLRGDTLDKFREAVRALNRAEAMVQRIDWLMEGDDSEDTFHRRWDEEVPTA